MFEYLHRKIDSKYANKNEKIKKKMFVLVNCYEGGTQRTIEELKQIDVVTDFKKTRGNYDIVATLESGSSEKLRDTVIVDMKKIKTVQNILTLPTGIWKTLLD